MSNFKIVKLVDPIQLNLAGGLNFQGDYDNATAYVVGDVVTYNGSSYAALQNTTGNLPTNTTYWQVLANKGDTGATGAGVASGGTTNQALTKIDGTDYNTQWSTVDKSFVGLGNVDNTSDANKPVSTATQTALDGKVDENVAITGATKTKITYDAKGLVTAGADATTADIADSLNKRYVTDANLTVIGNTSGTNTGDNATNSQYSGLDAAKVNKAGDTMTGNLNMGTNKLIGGTRITDVLKLQGTTDNGTLTSPAIQLLTGNNGATTALTVLNNGNVGIGTTNPIAKLDVMGDTWLTSGNIYLSNNYGIISKTVAGTNKDVFYVDTGNSVIFGANAGGWNSIQFKNGATPQMLIDSTGKIGINTTTPGAKLQVDTGASTTIGQIIKGAAAQTADLLQVVNSSDVNLLKVTSSGNALFGTNSSSLVAAPLNVSFGGTYGNSTPGSVNNLKWDMFNSGAGNRYGIGMSATLMEYQAGTNGQHAFFVSQGTEALRIKADGNVGIGTTTPSSTLDLHGSFELDIVNKTANYTAASETIINCTANTFTVTLPTAVGIDGRYYTIKNSGTGVITVATTSSQTIDGAATKSLPTQYDKVTVVSDGANWIIIG